MLLKINKIEATSTSSNKKSNPKQNSDSDSDSDSDDESKIDREKNQLRTKLWGKVNTWLKELDQE